MITARFASLFQPIGRVVFVATIGMAAMAAATLTAQAQTAEQRAACTPDAMRLCASEIPNIAAVKACMQANRASLSPRCQASFAPAVAPAPSTAVASAGPSKRRALVAAAAYRTHAAAAQPSRTYSHRVARTALVYNDPAPRSRHRHARMGQAIGVAMQMMSAMQSACANGSMRSDVCAYQQMIPGLVGSMGSQFAGSGYGQYLAGAGYGEY